MTEPVAKLDVHDGRREVFGVGMLDWFHCGEAGHTTARDQVDLKTVETRMLASRVGVDKENEEWCFDGELIHQFGGLCFGRVCKCVAWACVAHTFYVEVHARPVVPKAYTV